MNLELPIRKGFSPYYKEAMRILMILRRGKDGLRRISANANVRERKGDTITSKQPPSPLMR